MYTLLVLIVLNARITASQNDWIFDERNNVFIHNKPTFGLFMPQIPKKIIDENCEQCPLIDDTDCNDLQPDYLNRSISHTKGYLSEPKIDHCFAPRITYHGGLNCLMAHLSCHYANLFIDGIHIKTGERKLWDLRMPYEAEKYFHHRWPYKGISSIAQCTAQGQWSLALGVRPYDNEKVIIEKAYCLP